MYYGRSHAPALGVLQIPGLPNPVTAMLPPELAQNPRVLQVLSIVQQLPADKKQLAALRAQVENEVPDCIDPQVQHDAQQALNYLYSYDYAQTGAPQTGDARLDQLVMVLRARDPATRQQLLLLGAALNKVQQNYPTCGKTNWKPALLGASAGLVLGLFVGIVVG